MKLYWALKTAKSSSTHEIHSSYAELIKQEEMSQDEIIRINNAFQTLGCKYLRFIYDLIGDQSESLFCHYESKNTRYEPNSQLYLIFAAFGFEALAVSFVMVPLLLVLKTDHNFITFGHLFGPIVISLFCASVSVLLSALKIYRITLKSASNLLFAAVNLLFLSVIILVIILHFSTPGSTHFAVLIYVLIVLCVISNSIFAHCGVVRYPSGIDISMILCLVVLLNDSCGYVSTLWVSLHSFAVCKQLPFRISRPLWALAALYTLSILGVIRNMQLASFMSVGIAMSGIAML